MDGQFEGWHVKIARSINFTDIVPNLLWQSWQSIKGCFLSTMSCIIQLDSRHQNLHLLQRRSHFNHDFLLSIDDAGLVQLGALWTSVCHRGRYLLRSSMRKSHQLVPLPPLRRIWRQCRRARSNWLDPILAGCPVQKSVFSPRELIRLKS